MNKKTMGKLSLFLLTILVVENLLLGGLILLWINRHCQKCHKVKCVERVLNKTCQKCQERSLSDLPKSQKRKKPTP